MGYKISWLAAQGMSKKTLLAQFGLRDTDVYDEANEAPFSCAELPTGWTILWSNDCEWADESKGQVIGRSTLALTCRLHEGMMWSEATGFDGEGARWSVVHDAEAAIDDLTESGALPAGYAAIKQQALAAQNEAGGADAEVDHVFDVPITLWQTLTGWRHDHWRFDWRLPHFTVVEPAF